MKQNKQRKYPQAKKEHKKETNNKKPKKEKKLVGITQENYDKLRKNVGMFSQKNIASLKPALIKRPLSKPKPKLKPKQLKGHAQYKRGLKRKPHPRKISPRLLRYISFHKRKLRKL